MFFGSRSPASQLVGDLHNTDWCAGLGRKSKEYTIGVDALGRGADFDPKKDSIVRVQFHRLRPGRLLLRCTFRERCAAFNEVTKPFQLLVADNLQGLFLDSLQQARPPDTTSLLQAWRLAATARWTARMQPGAPRGRRPETRLASSSGGACWAPRRSPAPPLRDCAAKARHAPTSRIRRITTKLLGVYCSRAGSPKYES